MTERKYIRYAPRSVLEAVNLITNQVIGTIANISSGGFLLTTLNTHIPDGAIFQFSLQEKIGGETQHVASMGATCLWHSAATSPDTFWSGFQIIDIVPEEKVLMEAYIKSLGSKN